MTKKHFIALADHIRYSEEAFTTKQLNILADFCRTTNPRFDRARWFDYIAGKCGPSGGRKGGGK